MQQYKKKAEDLLTLVSRLEEAESAVKERDETIRAMELEAAFYKQAKDQ
jgi:hypothetical protein